MKVKVKSLSHGWLFATPWTVAYQPPQSMEFSRQEYWSGCHYGPDAAVHPLHVSPLFIPCEINVMTIPTLQIANWDTEMLSDLSKITQLQLGVETKAPHDSLQQGWCRSDTIWLLRQSPQRQRGACVGHWAAPWLPAPPAWVTEHLLGSQPHLRGSLSSPLAPSPACVGHWAAPWLPAPPAWVTEQLLGSQPRAIRKARPRGETIWRGPRAHGPPEPPATSRTRLAATFWKQILQSQPEAPLAICPMGERWASHTNLAPVADSWAK